MFLNKTIRIKIKYFLLLLVILLIGGYLFLTSVPGFLAKHAPIQADILVIEGWMPDYALEEAKKEFETHKYYMLITTGGPLEIGSPLSEYKSSAELAASILRKTGMDPSRIFAVPAPPAKKDRTFTAALAFKEWIQENQVPFRKMNLISLDVHARRSHLLFRKALGKDFSVGIIAVDDQNYDDKHWWKSSTGFRKVLDEWVAYCYARFSFLL